MHMQPFFSAFRAFYTALRLSAKTVALFENRLKTRNQEILLEIGREQAERELEREFSRINKFVERDMGGYSKLQLSIRDSINHIEEDFLAAGEIPPPPADWLDAITAVAKLEEKQSNGSATQRILHEITETGKEQQRESLQAYRQSAAKRHSIFKNLMPYLRRLSHTVDQIGGRVDELLRQAKVVDNMMQRYESIIAETDKASRMVKDSVAKQFILSFLVMVIAVGGAFFNFLLVAEPMSELVGAKAYIAGIRVADLAGMIIICLRNNHGYFLDGSSKGYQNVSHYRRNARSNSKLDG